MTLEQLQKEMIAALKAKDSKRKESISLLIAAIKKTAIDAGCRDDIKEEMVDQVLLKELKSAKEEIETCPKDRTELLEEYSRNLRVIEEFAPKQFGEDEIEAVIREKFADVIASGNKGLIMKTIMPEFRGKADGKLVNRVIAKLTAK